MRRCEGEQTEVRSSARGRQVSDWDLYCFYLIYTFHAGSCWICLVKGSNAEFTFDFLFQLDVNAAPDLSDISAGLERTIFNGG